MRGDPDLVGALRGLLGHAVGRFKSHYEQATILVASSSKLSCIMEALLYRDC